MLHNSEVIGPSGKNMMEWKYDMIASSIVSDQHDLRDLSQQAYLFPNSRTQGMTDRYGPQMFELESQREKLGDQLRTYKGQVRNYDHDPAVIHAAKKLEGVIAKLKSIRL